jgi:hypothetical protein
MSDTWTYRGSPLPGDYTSSGNVPAARATSRYEAFRMTGVPNRVMTSRGTPEELGPEVTLLDLHRCPGRLHERGLEPRRAEPQARRAPFAGALIQARTEPGPGPQVRGAGKAGRAEPDLGNQHVRDEVADARNGRQPRDRLVHGGEQLRHAAL